MTTEAVDDKKPRTRLDYIDGLRGLAVLMVIITHTWTTNGAPALSFHIHHHSIVLAALPAVGYIGVDLFLVLSGFCLAYPFMRNPNYRGRITVAEFWKRRYLRIAPAYYVSIALVFVFYIVVGHFLHSHPTYMHASHADEFNRPPPIAEILPHLVFIHNLSVAHFFTINGAYWSLGLEFQLYFAFPLLLELCVRWGVWKTVLSALALQAIYSTIVCTGPGAHLPLSETVLNKAVFGRLYEFSAGIVAAYIVSRPADEYRWLRNRVGLCLSAIVLTTAFVMATGQMFQYQPVIDILWPTGFAMLVCCGAQHGSRRHGFLSYRPLVRIGEQSYSIYLVHLPLIVLESIVLEVKLRPGSAFIVGMLSIPVIIGIGVVFYRLVEHPFLEIAQRSRARAAAS